MRYRHFPLAVLLLAETLFSGAKSAKAEDWPMWRNNAGRTATTSQHLSDRLRLLWAQQLAPPSMAWPEDPKMMFDRANEPIVVGKRLYVASTVNDSVVALDTESGREKWRFFTEGPVRLAPVVADGKIYFGSDDGAVYCLAASDGRLLWKIPSPFGNRTALGNDRLISLWPIRGGLVIHKGWLYYAAGVWPFEGAALFRVDLSKPAIPPVVEVITTFNDDSPQGYLAAGDDVLFVPCGRGPATCIDVGGAPVKLSNFGADMRTDCHLTVSLNRLFQGQRVIDFKARKPIQLECSRPVTDGDRIYFAQNDNIVATDISKPPQSKNTSPSGNPVALYAATWHVSLDSIRAAIGPQEKTPQKDGPLVADLLAGDRLVGHWGNLLFAIQIPGEKVPAHVVWTTVIDGTPTSLIAADGKLFVSTREGQLLCLADVKGTPIEASTAKKVVAGLSPSAAKIADLLKDSGAKEGYCVVWGIGDGTQVDELVRQSALRLIVIDPDAGKVGALRRRLLAAGLYGSRMAARVGDAHSVELPQYLANLVLCGDAKCVGMDNADAIFASILPTLRPYGGTAYLELNSLVHDQLAYLVAAHSTTGAKIAQRDGYTVLGRPGALPGAADWTHEYADAANSLMSHDKLVAAPLGVLWFGGPASDPRFFYDRHLAPPSPIVVSGRMFLQGSDTLAAVDIYTGRVLWQRPIEVGSSPDRRINFDMKNLDTGHNMAAADDAVYLCYDTSCLRIDPVTGKTLAKLQLPEQADRWGEIHIMKNRLLVTVFNPQFHEGKVPAKLVALDCVTGKPAWTHTPTQSCPLVATGNGKVFLYDGLLKDLYRDGKRRGNIPQGDPQRYLKALDAESGRLLWQQPIEMVASWLAHSPESNLLVASNHEGIEVHQGDSGQEMWRKSATSVGFKGHPESRWDRLILWNDRIIDQRGPGLAYDLKTGKPITRLHPLTGDTVPWEFTTTAHNCSYAIACENVVTFRDGTAGYCDVADGMTVRLTGFRPGCRSSLIPAGGVLNAPNMANGCSCGFSVFTSLALVHVSDAETWSYSSLKAPTGRVTRLGINLGAPGDRLASDSTLWLDWPSNDKPGYVLPGLAGPSPDVKVKMDADNPRWFRFPTRLIQGPGPNWVAASGVEGIRSLTIPLGGDSRDSGRYTVRLFFMEPNACQPGERVFDVAINGHSVLSAFDPIKAAGGTKRSVVREFADVDGTVALQIDFKPKVGRTLLCGVEIVAHPK
ncbi:MAG: PQQ-binding-like beta-propeller repeat protein [Planctomycetes bacterium]|nr:PQQ-binding-like beta-propeller repeat protein [Planctomycetota bacterium]